MFFVFFIVGRIIVLLLCWVLFIVFFNWFLFDWVNSLWIGFLIRFFVLFVSNLIVVEFVLRIICFLLFSMMFVVLVSLKVV